MSGTGDIGWLGYPPVVSQTQRILLSQIPEEDREAVQKNVKHELTRSNEPVFKMSDVVAWKRNRK